MFKILVIVTTTNSFGDKSPRTTTEVIEFNGKDAAQAALTSLQRARNPVSPSSCESTLMAVALW